MNILFRLTQTFLFLIPFQVAISPIIGIDLPFSRILSLVLFGIYIVIGLSERKLKILFSWEALFLGLFLFFSILSIFWAENIPWALRRSLFFLSFLPLFPVFTSLLEEIPDAATRLFRPFVFGAGLAALIGILEFSAQYIFGVVALYDFWTRTVLPIFLGDSFASSVAEYPSLLVNIGGSTVLRASAFFPDPHMAAFYFGIAFPVVAYFFLDEKTVQKKVFFGLLGIVILLADLLTFSRGGYVGLSVGSISAIVGYVIRGNSTRKRKISLMILLLLFFFGICAIAPVRERLMSVFSMEEGSNIGRMDMYSEAIQNITRQPWGYGLGNYPLVIKPTAGPREPIYAHDLFLDIATESGILGAISFFLAIAVVFRRLLSVRSGIMLAGAASLLIFFSHAIFETPLYSVHILPIFLLLLALPAGIAGTAVVDGEGLLR
ncbi:MAG: O-antigen ligase family protein [Candidatus Moraniibacteriota bacterium]